MSSMPKTGRVKFFNPQKGYGFIVPNEPIDGNAEVFVHHTVIHNRGGFKSLAEGELVEFDVTRGPKGLQATKVTGPSGTFVRGDPYFRLRPKIVSASIGGESSSVSVAASPYFTYSHYPPMAHHPAGYSQLIPFNSQMPQPHYGAYAYSATQPTNAPFVIPPPLPANTAIRPDAHAHIALSPQYFSVSYPAQTQAHQGRGSALGQSSSQQQLSAITIPYDSFFVNQPQRQQQNQSQKSQMQSQPQSQTQTQIQTQSQSQSQSQSQTRPSSHSQQQPQAQPYDLSSNFALPQPVSTMPSTIIQQESLHQTRISPPSLPSQGYIPSGSISRQDSGSSSVQLASTATTISNASNNQMLR
ncbi:hypothetical protein LPJ64_004195 [Coemansia asiatica]|uniref:CSD domain-containing protein n=1 Tax=Coemansia asiatica TaxID=1052880 RepID=A0A9W7XIR8_9FUNG|nr:hypothetical protein LPJ64_004195 [Coemansia asiatica]